VFKDEEEIVDPYVVHNNVVTKRKNSPGSQAVEYAERGNDY